MTVIDVTVLDFADPEALALAVIGSQAFEDWLRTVLLNQLAPAAGAVDFGFQRAMQVAAGIFGSDAATVEQSGRWVQELEGDAWTRTSNTTFTITDPASEDLTARYVKGTKVKWQESGTQKYGVVKSVAFATGVTTVTLVTTTSYVMAATPDAGTMSYAYGRPDDFPSSFAFTPVFTGFSAGPTAAGWWRIDAGMAEVLVLTVFQGTSNSTALTVATPIDPGQAAAVIGEGSDAGTACMLHVDADVTNKRLNVNKDPGVLAFTASGLKSATFQIRYPI